MNCRDAALTLLALRRSGINPNDILCGGDARRRDAHSGNINLEIRMLEEEATLCPHPHRTEDIARNIVNDVTSRGGRFLTVNGDNVWLGLPKEAAVNWLTTRIPNRSDTRYFHGMKEPACVRRGMDKGTLVRLLGRPIDGRVFGGPMDRLQDLGGLKRLANQEVQTRAGCCRGCAGPVELAMASVKAVVHWLVDNPCSCRNRQIQLSDVNVRQIRDHRANQ